MIAVVTRSIRGFSPDTRAAFNFVLAAFLSVTLITAALPAYAQGLIRDAEIESLLRDYSKPIFKVAGLSQQDINIHLIGQRSFNAFVVDAHNMFF